MKKWQCTVCGYVHTGEEPPETCPVCGADKSKFIEITETDEKSAPEVQAGSAPDPESNSEPKAHPTDSPAPSLLSYETLTKVMVKHHIHPISVHVPNGVIPVAVAFIFLAVIFQFAGLSKASFYNMVFVVLTLPVVLFTGYNEWQKKYNGAVNGIFKTKIISAVVVTVTALVIVLWHIVAPETFKTGANMRPLFLLLHLVMLAATGIAGHIGGKLVFKD